MDTFLRDNVTEEELSSASEYIAASLYGEKLNMTLSNSRFQHFCKLSKTAKFSLAQLPPIRDAIKQHGLRAYFQIQQWQGNHLNPLNWGWKILIWNYCDSDNSTSCAKGFAKKKWLVVALQVAMETVVAESYKLLVPYFAKNVWGSIVIMCK